jgi:hypothetical protein
MRWRILAPTIAFTLGLALPAAAMVTINFDPAEIGSETPQPADGQSVLGVTFSYTLGGGSSNAAVYGAPGPDEEATEFLQGTVLEGDPDGVLTLEFDPPIDAVEFAVALPTIGVVAPAFSVAFFDPDLTPIGSVSVDTSTQPGRIWSEVDFMHSGEELRTLVVTFDPAVVNDPFVDTFWLDNLSFAPLGPEVPALGSWGLATLALALLLSSRWCRQQRRA